MWSEMWLKLFVLSHFIGFLVGIFIVISFALPL